MKKLFQKIKDFCWVFIVIGAPLKEIRRLIENQIQKKDSHY